MVLRSLVPLWLFTSHPGPGNSQGIGALMCQAWLCCIADPAFQRTNSGPDDRHLMRCNATSDHEGRPEHDHGSGQLPAPSSAAGGTSQDLAMAHADTRPSKRPAAPAVCPAQWNASDICHDGSLKCCFRSAFPLKGPPLQAPLLMRHIKALRRGSICI